MRKHPVIVSGICIVLVLIVYLLGKPRSEPSGEGARFPEREPPSETPAKLDVIPGKIAISAPSPQELADISSHPEAVSFGSDPKKANEEARALFKLFDYYREMFGSFPAGEGNTQFMNALRGANPERLPIFPYPHPRINGEGEIIDFWGSPFFFHQVSADRIEVRSSGPDREIFTDDDIIAPRR